MVRGSEAPENVIPRKLLVLECAGKPFVDLARWRGIKVSQGNYSEVLAGMRNFERSVAERLLELIEEMERLQKAVGFLPINWTRTERVGLGILAMNVQACNGDNEMGEIITRATESVRTNVP